MFKKETIIKLLEERGWSNYKLCKEANLASATLSDILNGKSTNPKTETLTKIANALDVPIGTFFDDEFESKKIKQNEENKKIISDKFKPILDSLDKAGDLEDEDIDEINKQMEFLINLKRKKK